MVLIKEEKFTYFLPLSVLRTFLVFHFAIFDYGRTYPLQWSIGMNQNLRVSIFSPIELCVRSRSFINANLVRNDERWLGFAGNDHIAQVAVVSLDITLASAESKSLFIIISCAAYRGERNSNLLK
jgi:hypothetical protein